MLGATDCEYRQRFSFSNILIIPIYDRIGGLTEVAIPKFIVDSSGMSIHQFGIENSMVLIFENR